MKRMMPWGITVVAVGAVLAQWSSGNGSRPANAATESQAKATQKIVVHLSQSEGDPAIHSALMGLGLAAAMRQQGADVIVMLDSEAPAIVKKAWAEKSLSSAAKDSAHPPMTLGKAIQRFVDAGGTIVMCPHCAASCGCEAGNLADGAKLAQQGELARVVLEADKILDY